MSYQHITLFRFNAIMMTAAPTTKGNIQKSIEFHTLDMNIFILPALLAAVMFPHLVFLSLSI